MRIVFYRGNLHEMSKAIFEKIRKKKRTFQNVVCWFFSSMLSVNYYEQAIKVMLLSDYGLPQAVDVTGFFCTKEMTIPSSICFYYIKKIGERPSVFRRLDTLRRPYTIFHKVDNSIRKHAYLNILKILQPKNGIFSDKNSDIFHISA